jgi:acyl-[acyl-carrier-protein] desaturase
VIPVLRNVGAMETTGLSAEGEKARDELAAFLVELDKQATRFTERRERIDAAKAQRG